MQPTDKNGPPSASGHETPPSPRSTMVPSVAPDSFGPPASDPSDPDAAMYAALAARPDWTTKPAVRAVIAELNEGLPEGQDLLFWEVARPRDPKPSDAAEHLSIAVPQEVEGQGRMELPSRRVYVSPPSDPRHLATVRSPGHDGPRPSARATLEVTLPSRGGAVPESPHASYRRGARARLVSAAAASLVGIVAVTLGLLCLFGAPAEPPARFGPNTGAPVGTGGAPIATDRSTGAGSWRGDASERSVADAAAPVPVTATVTAAALQGAPVVPVQGPLRGARAGNGGVRQASGNGATAGTTVSHTAKGAAVQPRTTAPLPPPAAPTVDASRPVPPTPALPQLGVEPTTPVKTRPKLPEQPDF